GGRLGGGMREGLVLGTDPAPPGLPPCLGGAQPCEHGMIAPASGTTTQLPIDLRPIRVECQPCLSGLSSPGSRVRTAATSPSCCSGSTMRCTVLFAGPRTNSTS